MDKQDLLKTIAFGALAGVAGALVIRVARSANEKVFFHSSAPQGQTPSATIMHKIESALPREIRDKLPVSLEQAGEKLLSFGPGSTGAAIFTAVRSEPEVVVDGAALGTAIWAAGYLGWLPAMGLLPPVEHRKPRQAISSLLQHMLYGVATVSAYRKLRAAMSGMARA